MQAIVRLILPLFLCTSSLVLADASAFHEGPLIKGYGKIATVSAAPTLPAGELFKVAFDVAEPGAQGGINRSFDTVARFLNMHNAAGVPASNIQLAVVVHGGAHRDLLDNAAHGGDNPNAELVEQLVKHGVQLYLCGQTAAYYGVQADDLLPGAVLSLSAMTAHAQLQQRGYTLNPF